MTKSGPNPEIALLNIKMFDVDSDDLNQGVLISTHYNRILRDSDNILLDVLDSPDF